MKEEFPRAKNPLILRYHRMLEAFSKSDDERDFYLDRVEGFILYMDFDKNEEDLVAAENIFKAYPDRYCLVPKLSYYETKKFMEGFVNEKVYDIDTKEKLLDVISGKEARENFLEYIYDHLNELDKWQLYYHERSRVRIIEWLRSCNVVFVFEEDLELPKNIVEKLKEHVFDAKVSKDVAQAREMLEIKAKTYYSSEALNPRPKRGRPPKQQAKVEIEPELTNDLYTTVPPALRQFLFNPEFGTSGASFSSKFDSEEQFLANMRGGSKDKVDTKLEILSQRLESLRHLSTKVKDVAPSTDKKLITALTSKSIEDESQHGEPKLSQIAQDLFPKKKVRATPQDVKELMEEKKRRGVKKVTRIQYKKSDKKE
jgi:hypothetical protein